MKANDGQCLRHRVRQPEAMGRNNTLKLASIIYKTQEGILLLNKPNISYTMRTLATCSVGLSDKIPVGVGLHQGSSLSPYLFAMIMDVLAYGIKGLSPWCMLYADAIVLRSTRREEVESN